jgi:hypothetical protein
MEKWLERFQVLTVVFMNVAIFWDIEPCSPYVNRRFGGTYHLHLQVWKSAEQETACSRCLGRHLTVCSAKPPACAPVPRSADFLPWRWRWYIPPKRRFEYRLHGAISQKMATFKQFERLCGRECVVIPNIMVPSTYGSIHLFPHTYSWSLCN